MAIGLLSELLRKNDDNFTWLSLTNNEIGIAIPEFTEALLKNISLRKVSCHAGFLGSLGEEDLHLLMESLSQLPHLQDLWIALPAKQAHLSASLLKTILESDKSHLSKLTVRGIDDEGCHVLGEALSGPSKQTGMTDLQIRGTAASTSNLRDGLQSKVTRDGILSVADMLKVNTTLERLDLSYKGLDDDSLQAIAAALKVNRKLQKLELNSPSKITEATAKGYESLVDTMRCNYSLQYLSTPAEGGQQKYMMELLAKLNRTGARALMRNTTDHTGLEDVLESVQENTTDATALFELLYLNPSLWDPAKVNVAGLNNNRPKEQTKVNPSSSGKRASFVKPPSDKASSGCASTIAQVARRTSTPFLKFVSGVSSGSAQQSSSSVTSSNIGMQPSKKTSLAVKPVMARWNENIFTKLDEEKRQNYKRWTPTVIENTNVDSVVPAAELTSASEESGSDSDDIGKVQPPKPKKVTRRASKRRSTTVISYEVPAVIASFPCPPRHSQKAVPAVRSDLLAAATMDADSETEVEPEYFAQKPAVIAKKPSLLESENGTSSTEDEALSLDQKPKAKKRAFRRRRGPIEISYDVPAVVASVTPSRRESFRRTNVVDRKKPPPVAAASLPLSATTVPTVSKTKGNWSKDCPVTPPPQKSVSLPSINVKEPGPENCPSSPLSPAVRYGAMAISGVAYIGSAMLRSIGVDRRKSF